mmetsp:Transcript_2398/g.6370  ORF Transcript_2398/g.6370 Transcript_2398/m.6370 type:complete len:213 (+) Transcript_2398:799-1437(+)
MFSNPFACRLIAGGFLSFSNIRSMSSLVPYTGDSRTSISSGVGIDSAVNGMDTVLRPPCNGEIAIFPAGLHTSGGRSRKESENLDCGDNGANLSKSNPSTSTFMFTGTDATLRTGDIGTPSSLFKLRADRRCLGSNGTLPGRICLFTMCSVSPHRSSGSKEVEASAEVLTAFVGDKVRGGVVASSMDVADVGRSAPGCSFSESLSEGCTPPS